MYWMLLPPAANAERHLADGTESSRDAWVELLRTAWDRIRHGFAPNRV